MFATNALTDSLGEIVLQLAKPIDQRMTITNDTVSSYLNFTQCSDDGVVQPLQSSDISLQPKSMSSDQQYKLQCSQTKPIVRFTPNINDADGEERRAERNLAREIGRLHGQLTMKTSLGRAAVRGQQFIVGTDDSESKQHYLMLVDGESMLTSTSANPIKAIVQAPEHIRDIRWVTPTLAIAALGKGYLQLYNINTSNPTSTIQPIGHMIISLHNDYIREFVPHPLMGNVIGTVGQDGLLNIADINRLTDSNGFIQQSILLNTTISSIRWPMYNQSVCVSVTTDSGTYNMYDTRNNTKQPVIHCETHNLALPSHFTSHVSADSNGVITTNPSTSAAQLYTHDRYTDHNVLLGYSNGVIKHIDMRNLRAYIDVIQDPYVEGIGNIEYNCRSKSCLVSGYTDFTVWKHEANGNARVWSHALSETNTRDNTSGYSCSATYFDDDTVLVTDSLGGVSLRIQGFN